MWATVTPGPCSILRTKPGPFRPSRLTSRRCVGCARALAALATQANFSETTQKFLGLLAGNGRAAALPEAVAAFEALHAAARGAVAAVVTTAAPMTAAQSKGVAEALRAALGKAPEIETRVDPALLGGIRVRVGSKLFDASLRSKLDSLKFALKRA